MLVLSRKKNETIMIGDDILITVVECMNGVTKLGIEAPKNVKVYRKEVYDAIQAENRAAAATPSSLDILGSVPQFSTAGITKKKKPS
ncbi:carbon storage regulator CsrA [Chrysiogenes arsenatis]|uniref:carbon storage regulator CsrA n=1 Tax=Chrysiogenes arsenatis TaxID=309797 RepID=UPI000403946C|nr:carbon storage regulator CsrA [Chrysiogenes arsenatis]